MDRDSLALLLARGMSVERIARRFGRHPSTVSYWMGKHGLQAPNHDKYAAKGGIARECLEELVEAGMSIAQIAEEVGRSKGTVRHWLRRYGLKTSPIRQLKRDARHEGQLELTLTCQEHGEGRFVLEGRGYYRCARCRQERVSEQRRRLKSVLVNEAGGRCVVCGYDRCVAALEFHHLDRATKRISVRANGMSLGLSTLREEAAKCVLLCSNCHAEVESGATTLPVK